MMHIRARHPAHAHTRYKLLHRAISCLVGAGVPGRAGLVRGRRAIVPRWCACRAIAVAAIF